MNPTHIGRMAYEHQRDTGAVPESVIIRQLREQGIEGDFGDAEFREAYLACEREWRRIWHAEGRGDGVTCAYCGQALSKQQTKWCRRECWSMARRKRAGASKQRDREIVRMRTEEGLTYREIGNRVGLSAKRILQIVQREAA